MTPDYCEGNLAPIVVDFLIATQHIDPIERVGEATWKSQSGIRAREFLFENELMDRENHITSRGQAWLKLILLTPLPVQRWVDPRTE